MSRPMDAIGTALTRTRLVLFEPFDASKYVALGFCMWLYRLGSVGGSSSGSASRSGGSWGGASGAEFDPAQAREAMAPVLAWGPVIAVVAAVGLVLAFAIVAAVLFLQSRGAFLVIDGIARNRGAVTEPWNTWAPEGNALFRFRLLVNGGALVLALLLAGAAATTVWSLLAGAPLGTPQWGLLALAGGLAGLVGLVAAIVDALATEFVAPLMYVRRCTAPEGFRELQVLVQKDTGGFALYVLLRILASIAVSALTGLLACLTCGVVLLPFVGTLILLPAFLFLRVFSMHFLAQQADDLAATLGARDAAPAA